MSFEPHVREYAVDEDAMADDPRFKAMRTLLRTLSKNELPFTDDLSVMKIGMPHGQDYMVFNGPNPAVYELTNALEMLGCEDYVVANTYFRDILGDGCPWRFRDPSDDEDEMLVVLRYYPQGHPELENISMLEVEG